MKHYIYIAVIYCGKSAAVCKCVLGPCRCGHEYLVRAFYVDNGEVIVCNIQPVQDQLDLGFIVSRDGDGYSLALGRLPEGLYRYTAKTQYNGETLTTEGSFAVEALHLEQANLTADHALLRSISAITGGKMYYPDQLDELRDELTSLKPVIYTHTRFSELLNLPWVLILIVLLLGAEWVLRKYHGEI